MDFPDQHPSEHIKCTKAAEKQRQYRHKKKQNETVDELLVQRQKNAERQQKFRQSLAQCKTNEKLLTHKHKEAERLKNYRKAKKQ